MNVWRIQNSSMSKNEDYELSYLWNMKIAFQKLLKTENLKNPVWYVKKSWDQVIHVGSPTV